MKDLIIITSYCNTIEKENTLRNLVNNIHREKDFFEIVASCIETVYTEEDAWAAADCTKKELIEWVEKLTAEQFKKIEEFFNTMPKLSHTFTVVNPNTKKDNIVTLEGLSDFFA